MKKTIITISFVFCTLSLIAQINSEKEAVNAMKWLLENPQIESKKIFNTKTSEITAWRLSNVLNPELHLKEKVDFIMELGDSDYSNEFSVIYDFGNFIQKIENSNYNKKLFEFYSIRGVLKYYKILIKLDENCVINYLDDLIVLSEKELIEKFTTKN
ncbi:MULTISPECIES: hypothetical protein [Croceibacter]|uniref:hypothetical protein n=1 Tax=Croceibacter TaxID=216431 RepID=UPI002356E528|nr:MULTISPECIES: hypothetical protein [Croceibacter]|tara:strand:+ start:1940 stop:2410 length:471 start_codon:yes stop_codon:yes gene_type:complete